jgi:hypothetical protein
LPSDLDVLVLDLLEWLGVRARPYAEITEVWRSSPARLPAWEEANARGYVNRQHVVGRGMMVSVSTLGRAVLRQYRPIEQRTTGAPYFPDRPGQTPGERLTQQAALRKGT